MVTKEEMFLINKRKERMQGMLTVNQQFFLYKKKKKDTTTTVIWNWVEHDGNENGNKYINKVKK